MVCIPVISEIAGFWEMSCLIFSFSFIFYFSVKEQWLKEEIFGKLDHMQRLKGCFGKATSKRPDQPVVCHAGTASSRLMTLI